MKQRLLNELNDIVKNLQYGNEYYEPINLHSINKCYEFINWMPSIDKRVEVNLMPNGFLSLSFRNNLDNAEIVFDKDHTIWVRNINKKVESGKYYNTEYVFYHIISEVLKLFE